ncbi:phosphopantetheine-binding protein [Dyadobacter sp. CY356]|uniref:phosphopantetheine-binding protein n=1 Tax=Dyadobacter sp. CY356 TaxID=2906442 RepID=UPI001F372E70|nr:phosphopantetheine-binding protein [Dyadobacter sp. CY356]MCF0058612.1 phosphopantetheine-binding protein [Dyadobacter sp. CY356]
MKEQLLELLSKSTGLPASSISGESHLAKDLGFDSLDTIDLVLQMEDEFYIAIPDEDYEKLQTVGQIERYLLVRSSWAGQQPRV